WEEITNLLGELISRAGNPRSDSVARKIIVGLPAQPIVSAEITADRYHVTPTAARGALNRLQDAGVLTPTRVGRRRDREWASEELFQLLDAFEYDITDQGTSPTRRPAPSPTRPPGNRRPS
ncbi:MAG: hypothetical protein ACRDYY_12485, partial [Acidimicrobiales bacterium]